MRTPQMPDSLRITTARWAVPARNPGQRAVRDAMAAAADAERSKRSPGDADILCRSAEMGLEAADETLRAAQPGLRARLTVAEAHLYVAAVCPRWRRSS